MIGRVSQASLLGNLCRLVSKLPQKCTFQDLFIILFSHGACSMPNEGQKELVNIALEFDFDFPPEARCSSCAPPNIGLTLFYFTIL